VAESVELATILLTDLVGSTRLATTVGPVRADELREEHFALLREAITSSGGTEVKNTGDGLMVAFQSASAAVRCAVAMQQRFERRYRDAEQGLHVRIGLGAGESTVTDGDYFGMPSIEAARLCDQAPADGILLSALVKALAGRCEGIELSSAGALELKGFPDPVEAFSVSWSPLSEEAAGIGRWPLPPLLRSVPPAAYVGRTQERAALEEALALARGGSGEVVLLSGEPGIGKSRLAGYAAHRAHSDGFAVCWGSCSEELAVPYEPWIEVCSQLIEHAPHELLESHVKRHGGELGRLAGNLRILVAELPEPRSSDPETERYLLFSAVAGLLSEVAETLPLCLVLDDLHWSDAQSLALLKHLLRTSGQRAMQVIATYRSSELGKDHPLGAVLADLRSLPTVQRIALHGLGTEEVVELLSAAAGHELEDEVLELAGEIAAETAGNPFFVGEMVRGLSESGALVFDESSGRWSVDRSAEIVLPESVREVIERRVERLGEEALEALQLAAVIGRTFDLELLTVAANADEARLLDHLEAAVSASLLNESTDRVGRFRFVHALINQTLYEGLGATRRARMHQHIAEALEQLYGADPGDHLAELALHWRLAAVSVDRAKAAGYSLKAGQQALANLAPAEGATLFAAAVELTRDAGSHEHCEALIGLGEAQRQLGDPGHRETLLEASRLAFSLADAEFAARAAFANSRRGAAGSGTFGEVDRERVEAIERALELDEPSDPARRARLLALKANELSWDPDLGRRRALAGEAIELARRAGDKAALAEVLANATFAIWSAGTLELRATLAEELADCAAELTDPALGAVAQGILFDARIEECELVRAAEALERWSAVAEQLGQPTQTWIATYMAAGLELLHGRLDAGERLAEQAFGIGRESQPVDAAMIYGAQLAFIRVYQGRGQEVIELVEQNLSANPGLLPGWRASLAVVLCLLDRHDEARAILDEAASDRFEHVTPNTTELTTLTLYAEVAADTHSSAPAAVLYEQIEAFGDQIVWVTTAGYGHTRLYLGLLATVLGRYELSDEHLSFACEFHAANDMPLWEARGQLGWAEALAARGDVRGVQLHAARAIELSREHGYGAFEQLASALIAAQSTIET
jgi:class 3 adenylate cyclase